MTQQAFEVMFERKGSVGQKLWIFWIKLFSSEKQLIFNLLSNTNIIWPVYLIIISEGKDSYGHEGNDFK